MYEGPKSLITKTINKLLIFFTGKRLNFFFKSWINKRKLIIHIQDESFKKYLRIVKICIKNYTTSNKKNLGSIQENNLLIQNES